MNSLDEVPFRVTSSFVDDPEREAQFVHAPEFEMPDCEEILIRTMHDFSLEKKVLYWIESSSRQDTPWCEVTTDVTPTAPPCWLLLVDSEENSPETTNRVMEETFPGQKPESLADNGEDEPNASMNAAQYSEEDTQGEASAPATSVESKQKVPPVSQANYVPGSLACFFNLPQPRPRTSPVPSAAPPESGCPKPVLVKHSQSVLLVNSVKNEWGRTKGKLASLLRPLNQSSTEPSLVSKAFSLHQRTRSYRNLKYRSVSNASSVGTFNPTPPSTPRGTQRPLTAAGSIPPIQMHKPTVAALSPYPCLPPTPGARPSLSSHGTHPDSTADLLSALSQEERDLIEPVLALGYPPRRAILALQKTGRQSLGQFLSYLSACDKLLKQGYEEAQVEEAMEMFQNPEKAAEFLHLLAQFNDMGFQQADIKEVLLLCENQGDNALEELMTRAQ
ncbi:ubiquitin-associated protein 1-like [Sphaerodactylus townsendi]|uniref:ubiquitin-associated protein 1-like n=1 Tax=Sphaerodactylus townsendi TaxID=933632 RepID=UPI0020276ADC|nr:ubiquitin-associated protein 1-like [Sphaerodactylus townsendi]